MLEQGRFLFGVGEFSPRMFGTLFMGSVCASFVTLAAFGVERAAWEWYQYILQEVGRQSVETWGTGALVKGLFSRGRLTQSFKLQIT